MRGKRASDCCSTASSRPLAWDGRAGRSRTLHPLTSSGSSRTATRAQPVMTAVASRSALHAMRGSAAFHGWTRVHAALHIVCIREDERLEYSSRRIQGYSTWEAVSWCTPTCKNSGGESRAAQAAAAALGGIPKRLIKADGCSGLATFALPWAPSDSSHDRPPKLCSLSALHDWRIKHCPAAFCLLLQGAPS